MLNGVLTIHVPKKGDAYLAGTVHVAKEVQTIQRYQLVPYMSEKRVKPESATVHVAKCFPILVIEIIQFVFCYTKVARVYRKNQTEFHGHLRLLTRKG